MQKYFNRYHSLLKRFKKCLIYLVLPNALNLSIYKGFRTSFLRPVHISYFCEGNVLRLAHSVGLYSARLESIGEIFCLLKHGSSDKYKKENYYNRQKGIFLMKSRRSFIKDLFKIVKDFPRALLGRKFKKS